MFVLDHVVCSVAFIFVEVLFLTRSPCFYPIIFFKVWSSVGIGAFFFTGHYDSILDYVKNMHLGTSVITACKFILCYPLVYHYLNGIRHLVSIHCIVNYSFLYAVTKRAHKSLRFHICYFDANKNIFKLLYVLFPRILICYSCSLDETDSVGHSYEISYIYAT